MPFVCCCYLNIWKVYFCYLFNRPDLSGHEVLFNDNISVLTVSPGFINTDVSTKLLREDGTEFGVKSDAQEKGMSAKDCAKGIISAIKNSLV